MRSFILSMTALVLGLAATQASEAGDLKVRFRVDSGDHAGYDRSHPVPTVPAHLFPRHHGVVVGGGYGVSPHYGYVTPGYSFPGFASPVYGTMVYRYPGVVYVTPRYYVPDYAIAFGF